MKLNEAKCIESRLLKIGLFVVIKDTLENTKKGYTAKPWLNEEITYPEDSYYVEYWYPDGEEAECHFEPDYETMDLICRGMEEYRRMKEVQNGIDN